MDYLKPKHLDGPPQKIGECEGEDVVQYRTKGGLFLVCMAKNNGVSVLGSGNHRAIARAIAKKRCESIVWTELSKSEHSNLDMFELMMPEAEAFTNKLRKINGEE